MKKSTNNRTSWTVEWKSFEGKWYSQKFFLYQEAAGFCDSAELKTARTVLIRESKENV